MNDAYADRMDREAREDDEYARRVADDRRDRALEQASIVLPARHEHETALACWSCGAPRGARCAAYCRSEHGS